MHVQRRNKIPATFEKKRIIEWRLENGKRINRHRTLQTTEEQFDPTHKF